MNFFYSIFIVLATSILTSIFSFWRFRTEKCWELKAETYIRIMESLHYIKKSNEASLVRYLDQNYPEYRDDEVIGRISIDSESINNGYEKEKFSKNEIAKIIDVNSFLIKKEALLELKKLQAEYARCPSDKFV